MTNTPEVIKIDGSKMFYLRDPADVCVQILQMPVGVKEG
jgi:hypothetical protein